MTRAAHFQAGGKGVFKCEVCERSTRVTTQANERICAECYELAGFENMLSDNGELTEADIRDMATYFDRAIELGSAPEKMAAGFPELWALASQLKGAPAPETRLTVRQLINEIWKSGKIRMPVLVSGDVTHIVVEKADLERKLREYGDLDVPAPWYFLPTQEGDTERYLDCQDDD